MEKQYVVRVDRRDGQYPVRVFGPSTLKDCAAFVKGWYEGFNLDGVDIIPEMALYRLYIEEVLL